MMRRLQQVAEAAMIRRCAWLAIAVAVYPLAAVAQANPPPGYHELELALTIARAGHDCPTVERIEATNNDQPGWDVLRPEVAVCRNGKRFLVVTSGRRNAQPVVRPLPAAGE
jgi:hypothetical protein